MPSVIWDGALAEMFWSFCSGAFAETVTEKLLLQAFQLSLPGQVTVMVALPAPTAVMLPFPSTEATELLLLEKLALV